MKMGRAAGEGEGGAARLKTFGWKPYSYYSYSYSYSVVGTQLNAAPGRFPIALRIFASGQNPVNAA